MRRIFYAPIQPAIFLLCIITYRPTHTADISEFTRVRENARLTDYPSVVVLSLLDCSLSCSRMTVCDGFNFFKFSSLTKIRKCTCLTSDDVINGVLTSQQDVNVYIKDEVVQSFEDNQVTIEVIDIRTAKH